MIFRARMPLEIFLEFEDELYAAQSLNLAIERRNKAKDWFDLIRILLGG